MSGRTRICVLAQLEPDNGLGDMILRNALLELVRRRYPASEITLIVGADHRERFAEFLQRHSLADDVLACPAWEPGPTRDDESTDDDGPARGAGTGLDVDHDFLACAQFDEPPPRSPEWESLLAEMRRRRFDICVVDPATTWLHAGIALEAGVPVRVGVLTGHPDDHHLTASARVQARAGGAPDLADILAACAAALEIDVPVPGEVRAPFRYRAEGPPPEMPSPRIAMHVGGGPAWNRRWPLENYVRLVDRLLGASAGSVLLVGATEDAENEAVVNGVDPALRHRVRATGPVSLGRTATVLAGCDLFVGSDSAPMHIAVAVGLPTVAVYGPCDGAVLWGRALPDHHVVSHFRPCHLLPHTFRAHELATCEHRCRYAWRPEAPEYARCLADITVDEVLRPVTAALGALTG